MSRLGKGMIVAFVASVVLGAFAVAGFASSHREAPLITEMPKVDGTDFYMFRSYEEGREGFVTLIANYLPLQDAYGGPNYFELDPDALYRFHIDNDGDAIEDITFQFRVALDLQDVTLDVGGTAVSIPLPNAFSNVRPSYTIKKIDGVVDGAGQGQGQNLTNVTTKSPRFAKPLDNVGNKTFPDYAAYAQQFIHDVEIPGCAGSGRVFVGQRQESFQVNLGETFDLVNLSNPLGPRDAQPSSTADKNVTTLALEVPVACLASGERSVIGAWTTAAMHRQRSLKNNPDFKNPTDESGPYVQVSRLGMPLVNEVVIGLKDKNLFNASQPKDDLTNFATYVTNPTLPEILELLFGGAGVAAPNNFPRADLVAAFVTGIAGLNADGGAGEMLRLNVSIAPTVAAAQHDLGVLGGDNAGFPNGRRPGDDVVDIELRVAMGVLCHAFPGVFCQPADAPSGNLPFTDGTAQNAAQFDAVFPYLTTPIPGSPNGVNGVSIP